MEQNILGIDISKASFDVVLLREGQSQYATFKNQRVGFQTLGKWLDKRKVKQVHVCMEATGSYGDELAYWLHEQGYRVSVVNPSRIKKYAESQLSRNKTDKGDAALIANFCLTQQPDVWTPPAPELRELRALVRYYDDLLEMRQQERNRLQAGGHSCLVQDSLTEHLAFLDQQIDTLLQRIRDHIDHYPDLKQQTDLLTSIPGLGDLTAFILLGEIGDFLAFDNANQLVAFAGMSPRHHQSGSSVRGRSHLAKIGNPRIRSCLYFPALTAKRYNPIIRHLADRLAAQHKPKMVIVAAAMRKLLVLAYGVLKSRQPFDPAYHSNMPFALDF